MFSFYQYLALTRVYMLDGCNVINLRAPSQLVYCLDYVDNHIKHNMPLYTLVFELLQKSWQIYSQYSLFCCLELYTASNHINVQKAVSMVCGFFVHYIETFFRYSTRKRCMDLVYLHAVTHFEYQEFCGIPSLCSWNTHSTLYKGTYGNRDTSMLDTQMLQHACTCYSLHIDSWHWSRMNMSLRFFVFRRRLVLMFL